MECYIRSWLAGESHLIYIFSDPSLNKFPLTMGLRSWLEGESHLIYIFNDPSFNKFPLTMGLRMAMTMF